MSSAERSYFVFGNLAAAYHNGHSKESAYVSDGTVYQLAVSLVQLIVCIYLERYLNLAFFHGFCVFYVTNI